MNLENLLIDSKAAWVDFPGIDEFSVQIVNLARPELNKLRKGCTVSKWDRKARGLVESLDETKFVHKFTEKVVKSWKGLTLEKLSEILLIDYGDQDPKTPVPYEQKTAEKLVEHSIEFDTWLNEVIFDLDNFRK